MLVNNHKHLPDIGKRIYEDTGKLNRALNFIGSIPLISRHIKPHFAEYSMFDSLARVDIDEAGQHVCFQ